MPDDPRSVAPGGRRGPRTGLDGGPRGRGALVRRWVRATTTGPASGTISGIRELPDEASVGRWWLWMRPWTSAAKGCGLRSATVDRLGAFRPGPGRVRVVPVPLSDHPFPDVQVLPEDTRWREVIADGVARFSGFLRAG